MDYKEIYIKNVEKKSIYLPIWEKLCERAKEIIFNGLRYDKGYLYFFTIGLDDCLIDMTPIEQIFYVSNGVYELGIENNFSLCLDPQKYINIKNKNYRCDFLIEYCCFDSFDHKLKKPIVIEVDGYDYHSSKKQMDYDYNRENELKLSGYDVIRFTGSQIFNHPLKCMEKVYEYCKKAEFEE